MQTFVRRGSSVAAAGSSVTGTNYGYCDSLFDQKDFHNLFGYNFNDLSAFLMTLALALGLAKVLNAYDLVCENQGIKAIISAFDC